MYMFNSFGAIKEKTVDGFFIFFCFGSNLESNDFSLLGVKGKLLFAEIFMDIAMDGHVSSLLF